MRPMTLIKDNCFETKPVFLYDHTIPIEERPKHKKHFTTGLAAANWLGVTPKHFYNQVGKNINAKRQFDENGNPKKFAIRVAASTVKVENE